MIGERHLLQQRAAEGGHVGEVARELLAKYDPSQPRDNHGRFGSGGSPQSDVQPGVVSGSKPVGQEGRVQGARLVSRDNVRVGDVILHPSPKYHGGKIVGIKPAGPGEKAQARGPRFIVQFADGRKGGMYLNDNRKWNVLPDGNPRQVALAQPGEIAPRGPRQPDANSAPRPAGAAKPDAVGKPAQGKVDVTDAKETGVLRSMQASHVQVGDDLNTLVRDPNGFVRVDEQGERIRAQGRVVGVKSRPGGLREIAYVDKDTGNVVHFTAKSLDDVGVNPRHDALPSAQERQVPTIPLAQLPDGTYEGMRAASAATIEVGDSVSGLYIDNRRSSLTGDVMSVREMGRGRKDIYVRGADGQIRHASFTKSQLADAYPSVGKPIADPQRYAAYREVAAAKEERQAQRQREMAEERERMRQAQEERDRRAAAANAAEERRQAAEVAAFKSLIDTKTASSSPAAPMSAGDTRNGGWGMTNAAFAASLATALPGAQVDRIKNPDGACNEGLFNVVGANGEALFAKRCPPNEISNEVLGALISQRLGVSSPATVPCRINEGEGTVITNPSELHPGQKFNGVIMERAMDPSTNGRPNKASEVSQSTAQKLIGSDQAQRTTVLDTVIANTDNHVGNHFVVQEGDAKGLVNFDNGLAFGYMYGGLIDERDRSPGNMKRNNTIYDLADKAVASNREAANLAIPRMRDTSSARIPEAMTHIPFLPLMTTVRQEADGSKSFTPTPFAASLRDNVAAAVADFQRSYVSSKVGVTMRDAPSEYGKDPAVQSVDTVGSGIPLLAGTLTSVLRSPADITVGAQVYDPEHVFSQSIAKTLINRALVKIGRLVMKEFHNEHTR